MSVGTCFWTESLGERFLEFQLKDVDVAEWFLRERRWTAHARLRHVPPLQAHKELSLQHPFARGKLLVFEGTFSYYLVAGSVMNCLVKWVRKSPRAEQKKEPNTSIQALSCGWRGENQYFNNHETCHKLWTKISPRLLTMSISSLRRKERREHSQLKWEIVLNLE